MFYWIPSERLAKFNESLRFILDTYGGKGFAADMMIALERNLSFVTHNRFMEAFRQYATNDQDQSLIWRLHVLSWAATQALHVEGDFVECGVYKGLCSGVICKYLDFDKLDRSYYLYDTFAGLTDDASNERERHMYRSYREEDSAKWQADVHHRFANYPNVKIVPGPVPHTFKDACPEKVAFLHLDMNAADAEILALNHLYERMSRGAMIVLDDFGWKIHRNLMEAHQKFFGERGHEVLELPTGQGLVIRH
jgi:O-methyltransferase